MSDYTATITWLNDHAPAGWSIATHHDDYFAATIVGDNGESHSVRGDYLDAVNFARAILFHLDGWTFDVAETLRGSLSATLLDPKKRRHRVRPVLRKSDRFEVDGAYSDLMVKHRCFPDPQLPCPTFAATRDPAQVARALLKSYYPVYCERFEAAEAQALEWQAREAALDETVQHFTERFGRLPHLKVGSYHAKAEVRGPDSVNLELRSLSVEDATALLELLGA